MPKMLVVTDAETALGFRLAGVEVRETDAEGAQQALEEVIASNDYGLVVVDESLIEDPIRSSERRHAGPRLTRPLAHARLGRRLWRGRRRRRVHEGPGTERDWV